MENFTRKTTIFILDDDRYYGLFLKNALKSTDYSIKYFPDEGSCIEELVTVPDILILDHSLEYTYGLEVLDEVSRKCKGKTHVIYLSAQEHVHIALRALKEGAVAYIEKNDKTVNSISEAIGQIISLTQNFKQSLDVGKLRILD